eukprot:8674402-Lingulodinium_polyedra.AAC.1
MLPSAPASAVRCSCSRSSWRAGRWPAGGCGALAARPPIPGFPVTRTNRNCGGRSGWLRSARRPSWTYVQPDSEEFALAPYRHQRAVFLLRCRSPCVRIGQSYK